MGEIELGAAAEATIQAYKELAADPTKRLALALDRTCIPFLAYVVAEGEGHLVQLAVDTLALIAQAKECRPSLANTFGVLEALQSLSEDEKRYSQALRDKAAGLFTSLQFAKHVKNTKEPDKQNSTGTSTASSSTSSTSSSAQSSSTPTTQPPPPPSSTKQDDVDGSKKVLDGKAKVAEKRNRLADKREKVKEMQGHSSIEKKDTFLGIHNTKAKVATLFIEGMVNQEHRQMVEEELVRVRGLISIVFDLAHSRVTCRVKRDLSVEKLAAAVTRTETFAAQQVTTNDKGEEEITPLGQTAPDATSPVEDLPEYLPEDEALEDEDTSQAMAPSGSFVEAASSWISNASTFLQKSFYW